MKKPTKRKAFNFLRSYFDVLNELQTDEDKLSFLLSIINKQFLNEDPKDLSFIVNLCYESQRHQIESSVKGWERASNNTLSTTPPTPLWTTPPTPSQEEEEEEEEKEEEKEKVLDFDLKVNKVKIQKFEKFYELYPKHKGNIRMIRDAFMELEDEEIDKIEKTLKDFLKEKEQKYIPFSDKYLEGRRWDDKDSLLSDNPFKGQVAR